MRTNLAFVKVIQLEFFSSLPQWRSSSGLFAKISKRRSSGGKKNESKWKFSCRKFSFRDVMTSFANKEKSFFFLQREKNSCEQERSVKCESKHYKLTSNCSSDVKLMEARAQHLLLRGARKSFVLVRENLIFCFYISLVFLPPVFLSSPSVCLTTRNTTER